MNIMFAAAVSDSTATKMPDVTCAIENAYGVSPHSIATDSPTICGGYVDDGGVILGCCRDGDVSLIFMGSITHPLETWDRGSPLDDPHKTAAFLLSRFCKQDMAFLDGITGQYAVIVLDAARARMVLAVDPTGLRTLYYTTEAGRLAVSNNLYCLAHSLGAELKIDRSLEDFFLIYGFYPWGQTPYCGITSLPAGTVYAWQDGEVRTQDIAGRDPWEGRYQAINAPGVAEEDVIDILYNAFLTATGDMLATDARTAVLLGGFDSALVAAVLKRLGKEVETFSFYYDDEAFNQPHTETLAKFLGIQHHWIRITCEDLEAGLRTFPQTFNQPTNWPNYVIQTSRLCQVIRERGIRYCYSGDGCDSVFLGYPGTFRRAIFFDSLPLLPQGILRAVLMGVAHPLLDRLWGHPYRVALNVLRALGRRSPARGYLSFRIMDEISVAHLRRSAPPPQDKPLEQIVAEISRPFANLPLLRLAYQGKSAVSPNKNKMIGSSDRHGLAILSPYLHVGMKNLATQLPERLMRPQAENTSKVSGKYILMRMAARHGLLPPEIIYQKKVAAVDGPIDAWYAGPLRPVLLDLMHGLPFDYREDYVESLLKPKRTEALFKKYCMTDKVISHAASLLATYAAFTGVVGSAYPGDDVMRRPIVSEANASG